jgi:hypothetical protein
MRSQRRIRIVHTTPSHGRIALSLIAVALLSAACGGAVAPVAAPTAVTGAPAGGAAARPTTAAQAGANGAPAARSGASGLDCAKITAALIALPSDTTSLLTWAVNTSGRANTPDSPLYVNTALIRADLVTLAALPDPTDPATISMMGRPSVAIAQYRQMLDAVDHGTRPVVPTPAAGADPGQHILDTGGQMTKMYIALATSAGDACPDQPTPAAGAAAPPPTRPAAPAYRVGQAGTVGALRVTVDRVGNVPATGQYQPPPGSRFILVAATVQNTGATPLDVGGLAETRLQSPAGVIYPMDPYVGLAGGGQELSGTLAPGAKLSGQVGYQVPQAASDLVWVYEDYGHNSAAFAIAAADVQGAVATEPTAAAARAAAAATMTAFVGLAEGADATNAAAADAPTETAAPDPPTDTVAPDPPTDTVAPDPPTDTVAPDPPTDVPAPTDTTTP